MCGIAGTLSLTDQPVSAPAIAAMTAAIAHRGPDGHGIWIAADGRVGFGHRRLAIIDPTPAADQPMLHGSLALSYNGEIYNHVELRRELEALGHHDWQTDHSDTEVLLRAYAEWGIDCLHRLRGMFAFALWDGDRRCLWLARDRVGIKPLFWSQHHGRISFASEIKSLLRDTAFSRTVDEIALLHYLTFVCIPAPRTLFSGIEKLEAGSWIRVEPDSGRVVRHRWWDPLDSPGPVGEPVEIAAQRIGELLRESVRLRLVSDVPVGIFLSGGIDSSANAILARSIRGGGDLHSFTVGYAGHTPSSPDETPYARKVAQRIGAIGHEVTLDEQAAMEWLPDLIRSQDEPIADPVSLPLHFVAELARHSGIVVALSGEGADELFCGYPSWITQIAVSRGASLPVPRTMTRAAASGLLHTSLAFHRGTDALARHAAGRPTFWTGTQGFGDAEKWLLLADGVRRRVELDATWHEVVAPMHDRYLASAREVSPLGWMTYADLRIRLPELLLARFDRMTMGVGVEGRVPFLDHELVSYAANLSQRQRIGPGRGEVKQLLKRALRGTVPDEILDRPKQGFRLPVQEWFDGALGHRVRSEVASFCRASGLLDERRTLAHLDRTGGKQGWYLLNLAMWWRHFVARESPADLATAPMLVGSGG